MPSSILPGYLSLKYGVQHRMSTAQQTSKMFVIARVNRNILPRCKLVCLSKHIQLHTDANKSCLGRCLVVILTLQQNVELFNELDVHFDACGLVIM